MLCHCRIPQRLITVVLTVTEPKLMPRPAPTGSPTPSAQAVGQASGALPSQMGAECLSVPADVRCHAWTALGKFCLLDEWMAKKMVPGMVQVSGPLPLFFLAHPDFAFFCSRCQCQTLKL